jgi:hypothetical protein
MEQERERESKLTVVAQTLVAYDEETGMSNISIMEQQKERHTITNLTSDKVPPS